MTSLELGIAEGRQFLLAKCNRHDNVTLACKLTEEEQKQYNLTYVKKEGSKYIYFPNRATNIDDALFGFCDWIGWEKMQELFKAKIDIYGYDKGLIMQRVIHCWKADCAIE